jgi:adhesin/invasin
LKSIAVTEENISSTAKQILGDYVIGGIKDSTPDFIKYIDMEYIFSDDYSSTYSLSTLSSIYETESDLFFNQTSLYSHDNNTTANIGFGYRNLLNDDKVIIGINAFYDRELKVTHQRAGLGIELLTSVFDLRSNYYQAFSDMKLVEDDNTEKALDGWDIRADYHLPSIIVDEYSVTLFTSYYDWSESGGDFSSDGYKIGTTAKLYKNLYVETALDDNGVTKDFYVLLNYSFKFEDSSDEVNRSNNFFELENVKHRMYEKVIRENKIIKVVKGAIKVKRGN